MLSTVAVVVAVVAVTIGVGVAGLVGPIELDLLFFPVCLECKFKMGDLNDDDDDDGDASIGAIDPNLRPHWRPPQTPTTTTNRRWQT